MCGIAGIVHVDPKWSVDESQIRPLCEVIRHRGPDEEGFYSGGGIGLGVRRLKIIDLATGSQPIHNEDKTVWVVFNGEIYNYRELRTQLEQKGHSFYTQTDTETIVHLYEEYEEECVKSLRGMFGFALWDDKRKRLLLARDRLGEKQLYYSAGTDSLIFGSEIKCLLQNPRQERAINPIAMRDFFTYLYIPGEHTIFQGIRRLLPGHLLVWEMGRVWIQRYWDLRPRHQFSATKEELVEEFRSHFFESVKLRMVSDVPLGAFLSGGIDSSAVVAVMAGLSSRPVKTFTIGYEAEGVSYDERRYARLIVDKFGTDHHEFIVHPQIEDIMPEIVHAFDEPFADSSAIPSYYVSKLTREHVTVAMSGVGGDEIGGGYERYLGVMMAEQYNKLVPRAIRDSFISSLIRRMPDSRNGGLAIGRAKRFIEGVDCSIQERYQRYVSTFSCGELMQLFVPELAADFRQEASANGLADIFRQLGSSDPLTQMVFSDFHMYLPDDLLVLTDRLSMVHSLEVRAPFLDHELVEFAAGVPSGLKLRGWTKKYLLKKAFDPLLPKQILWRKKMGFSVPLAVWLRGALRPYLLDWLSETKVARLGYFNKDVVSNLVREHLACRHNHENKLWALLNFMVWHNRYMEQPTAAAATRHSLPPSGYAVT